MLLQWLDASDNNKIHWGWYLTGYTHPALQSLNLHLGKLHKKGRYPAHPSAATACRVNKEEQKAQSHHYYHNNNLGVHFPNLGPASNKAKLQLIDNCHNNPHTLARLTHLLTGHAPIGCYYTMRPYFYRDTTCTCDNRTLQSRNHILDHCPLYICHCESWLNIQKIKEHPLQELIEFLYNNPLAFTFEHTPGLIPSP